jgi:hypothetical protein
MNWENSIRVVEHPEFRKSPHMMQFNWREEGPLTGDFRRIQAAGYWR